MRAASVSSQARHFFAQLAVTTVGADMGSNGEVQLLSLERQGVLARVDSHGQSGNCNGAASACNANLQMHWNV